MTPSAPPPRGACAPYAGPPPAAAAPPPAPPAPPDPPAPIALPLEYRAFCQLHNARYRAYARVRIRQEALADRAVAEALGDLAVNWKQALSGSPAALAWDLLGDRVRAALRAPAAAGESEALQRMLPPLQADLVILRHKLTLGTAESAGLLGLDVSTVVSNLAAARRTLSGAAAGPGAARRPPC